MSNNVSWSELGLAESRFRYPKSCFLEDGELVSASWSTICISLATHRASPCNTSRCNMQGPRCGVMAPLKGLIPLTPLHNSRHKAMANTRLKMPRTSEHDHQRVPWQALDSQHCHSSQSGGHREADFIDGPSGLDPQRSVICLRLLHIIMFLGSSSSRSYNTASVENKCCMRYHAEGVTLSNFHPLSHYELLGVLNGREQDGQDEQLVPDDNEGGHLQRWAVRVCAGVIGLLLMAALGMLLRAMDHRHPASPGAKLSIGVLLTDTPLDKDLLRAALRAAREQHSASVRLSDIHVKQAQTHGTVSGAIDAFKKLWNEGVKIFLIGGENSDILISLCKHIESSGHASLLVSPETMVSQDVCPSLVSLSPAQETVTVVEAGRLLEAKVSHVVPVVTTFEAGQLTHLVKAAEARNLTVTPAVLLDPQHISLAQLKERLAEYPKAGVWMSLGSDLPHIFAEVSYLVCGRLVMLHAHAAHRARLLRHPLAREAAEKCGVCSAAWAGSTRIDTAARRRLLDDLQPEDPLFASLAYDITGLALAALTVGRDASVPELRAQILNYGSLKGVTGSMKDGRRSGWVARLRLVAQRLVGWAVLQDTPWLLEGCTQIASEEEGSWAPS
ncbi:uncharacterized protein LOC119588232 [Penaeus monodon]|uniref:uncharacterized protein LOC119588232 n=1 Tax=Penaeus monodon TaxID=6687 RepID=UPI0018A7C6E7|nr:uncharacterized protein LOC119588232 [Penaeus monodon]